ncbi:hypothetical protein AB0N71_06760 [Pseudarthrobacter enclensis]|uniref:hypothetical protein n=1 Tax=Pseudarthrobacter enclensis TaxID=993070 RepID=UPI0034435ABA
MRAGLKVTRAGSNDNDANDWQVNPAGPCGVEPVITVNPLAKVPKISRSRRGVRSDVAVMCRPLVGIVTSPNHPEIVFDNHRRNALTQAEMQLHPGTNSVTSRQHDALNDLFLLLIDPHFPQFRIVDSGVIPVSGTSRRTANFP